ncbi:RING-type domain-containing protein [Plasmodiophora brassicae]
MTSTAKPEESAAAGPTPDAVPKILISSFLFKRGNTNKNWRRRFFALYSDGQLHWYLDTKDEYTDRADGSLGHLCLADILLISEPGPLDFALTQASRTYHFRADSAYVLNKWREAFQPLIDKLDKKSTADLNVVKHGSMFKKGRLNFTSWCNRYFALMNGQLFYFARESDFRMFRRLASGSPSMFKSAKDKYVIKSLSLRNATVDMIEDGAERMINCLVLRAPENRRDLIMSACSRSRAQEWVDAMRKEIEKEGNARVPGS